MVYKMLSLTTSDIAGATPAKPFRFLNKPPKDEIEGSHPKSQLKSWDRPVLNLTATDITGCHPVAVPIREHTRRSVNPLNPTYKLPAFSIQSTPEPKFLRDTMDWSDLLGSTSKTSKSAMKLTTVPKDLLKTADIAGAQVGTTPRSAKKKHFARRRPVTSLDVTDINGRRFRSQKNTNPLSPEYVMRVESDLGYMGRAASAFADEVKKAATHNIITNQLEERFPKRPATVASYHKTDLDGEKDSAVKNLAPLYDRISTATGTRTKNTALMRIGPVDRSRPGWRPKWDNKPEADANLRTADIEGSNPQDLYGLWTSQGGVWGRSSRQRREVRLSNTLSSKDIEGSSPHLKKDTFWRSLGRHSDPVDPIYVPLDGMEKAGLLEREMQSKTVNTRRAMEASYAIPPDQHVARSLADEGKLSEKVLSDTFKAVDGDHVGEISYPDFTQAMAKLGVAIPGTQAINLAHQLDYGRSGKIKYEKVHEVLGEAYDRQQERQRQEEEADRMRIGTPTPHRKNPFKISPMIQLKDKLYQKYGQMYDSFKGFDKNHSGLISCEQFANVVVKMNTGIDRETALNIAKEVDIDKDGQINYFEFSNKLDYGDDVVPSAIKAFEHRPSPTRLRPDDEPGSMQSTMALSAVDSPFGQADGDLPTQGGGTEKFTQTSRAQSRAGSRAGSRASSRAGSRLGMVDSTKALAMEREAAERREELRQVEALPQGTPR